eukprot:556284-Prorocentrum_minimum.AAC.1
MQHLHSTPPDPLLTPLLDLSGPPKRHRNRHLNVRTSGPPPDLLPDRPLGCAPGQRRGRRVPLAFPVRAGGARKLSKVFPTSYRK